MTPYLITVTGCDDSTEVIQELAATERRTIERLAAALKETSTSDCMPTMQIRPAGAEDIARVTEDAAERRANP